MKKSFFHFPELRFQKHRLGDKDIAALFNTVDVFNKMCSQQAFRFVSLYCISDFFTCHKSYFRPLFRFVEKDEIGCMPRFAGVLVNPVELFTAFQSREMFYTANLFLPFALLAAITFLPFFVFILARKPCVLFFGVLCG